jgi:hypothetical protein
LIVFDRQADMRVFNDHDRVVRAEMPMPTSFPAGCDTSPVPLRIVFEIQSGAPICRLRDA